MRRRWIALLGPLLRYSYAREAFVLRGVGRRIGPVLRVERRGADGRFAGVDRRQRRGAAPRRTRVA